jgi:hypothetical protein
MKKLNTEALEKMAKQKNIDKDKIEKIANDYKGKSENELMDELVNIGKNLQGKDEVISKFKTFLDDDQRKKLDVIMNKISDAEVQTKLDSKKSKQKKSSKSPNQANESNTNEKHSKKTKSPKDSSSSNEKTKSSTPNKKTKKVIKKVKRLKQDD